MERKYSVSEIDRMRRAVKLVLPAHWEIPIEEALRTYMMNGTDPDELEAAANSIKEERRRRQAELNAVRG